MVKLQKLAMQGFKSFSKKTVIPLYPGFNAVIGPNGNGKCIAGSSRVMLADGSVRTIGEMVENGIWASKNVETLDDGFCCNENPECIDVLSLNPETLKMEKKSIAALIKRKSPAFLLRIKTRTGKEITATHYHPLFTIKGGAIMSVKAEELVEGIKIALPRILPAIHNKNGLDIIDILGSFKKEDLIYIPYSERLHSFIKTAANEFGGLRELSEISGADYDSIRGARDKQAMNAADFFRVYKCNGFKREDISWIEELKSRNTGKIRIPKEVDKSLARFLGYIISEGQNTKSNQVWFVNEDAAMLSDFASATNACFGINTNEFHYKTCATDSIIFSKPLCKFIDRLFGIGIGEKSAQKKVPLQIFGSGDSVVSEFLSALFEGDAHIHISESKKYAPHIEYSSASKKLAEDISLLLLRFGIRSTINEKIKWATNTESKTKRKYYSVYIYGSENMKKAACMLNFVGKKKDALEKIKAMKCTPNPNIDLIPNINSEIKKLANFAGISIKKLKKTCPKLDAYCYNQCEASREGLSEVLNVIEKNSTLNKDAKNLMQSLGTLANSDIFWDEITQIEKIDAQEWVYDLSIEKNHNFIADGFIVHNSNIIDAIVFVLGTASRNLRAERMQHVIYNGGHGSKPADAAIVSLVIDNSDKTLKDQGELVLISRRVNRRGNSVYRLNGKAVNRRKILDIMAEARIDPEGYNIIQQGDITNLIQMRPKERREIIDEAAGIKEYNDKKAKALKELDVAERNVSDAEIVIGQKKEFLDRLKADRDTAIRYNSVMEKMDLAKATLAFTRVKGVEGALENVSRNLSIKQAELGAIGGNVDTFDKDLENFEKHVDKINAEILKKSVNAEARKDVEEIRSKLLKKEGEIDGSRRELERLEEMISKITQISQSQPGAQNASVSAIMGLRKKGVLGSVSSIYRTSPKYETAIEVALGGHMNDVVVDSESTAIECISYLKSQGLGRVRFLPLDRLRPVVISAKAEVAAKMPGVIDFALNLIRYDKKYENAFGDILRDALVSEDVESARKIKGLKTVTLEGELFESGGAIVGGNVKLKRKMSQPESQSNLADVSAYEKERDELEEEISALKKEIGELNVLLDEKTAGEKAESNDVKALEREREKVLFEISEMKRTRRSKYESRLNLEAEINELKLQKARLETELTGLMVDYERYKQRTDLIKGDPNKLEREIRDCDRQLRAIGPVNLKAIDEFDALNKDFETFRERFDKLKGEKESIIGMIAQIEEKRKVIFMTALSAITQEFSKVFRDLISGDAELLLENPNDIESGLLIKAQPKEKRLLSIDLLSGGEKTMTAIAFLFAIQRFRPSPFYLLDEIDAALDKTNASTVGDFLTKYARESQFIVVSHSDVTVKKSERVYGVTMQKGVSQVFGVELRENGMLEAKK